MKTKHCRSITATALTLVTMGILSHSALQAETTIKPAPQGTEWGKKLLEPLGDPINQGRLLYDARLRYEYADQESLLTANAFTLRQRLGYETPRFSGFYGLVEGEHNWALNDDYSAYPPPFNAGRTVIADGENFALNRAYLGFTHEYGTLTAGRQDINLGNQRYVGTVAWRQNDQTFDALRLVTGTYADFSLDYTWNWQVNRVFGTKSPTLALRRIIADNHFVNLNYKGIKGATLSGYYYSLNLRNLKAMSSDTGGVLIDGTYKLDDTYSIVYRAEAALQTDNSHTAGAGYDELYLHFKLGLNRGKWQGGIGYESLGGDGTQAFQTPLATLHAFNGWADTFLTTPANGLRDYYAWAGGPLFAGVVGRLEAHYYTSDENSTTYGREYSLLLTRKINDNVSVLLKGSLYDGQGAGAVGADKEKVWLQIDFKL